MAFRSQTIIGASLIALLALPLYAQSEFRFTVRHISPTKKITRKALAGELVVNESGISFREAPRKKQKHPPVEWKWAYPDIQQLTVADDSLTVLTYADSKWKLGADRSYRFETKDIGKAYPLLRSHLNDHLIAALSTPPGEPAWELRVKHLVGLNRGTEGILRIGKTAVTYSTLAKEDSRIWNLSDIENISSSGPYELTLSTYEHSRSHYNSYRAFHFQLKDRLVESKLHQLWLELNRDRQLNALTSYQKETAQ